MLAARLSLTRLPHLIPPPPHPLSQALVVLGKSDGVLDGCEAPPPAAAVLPPELAATRQRGMEGKKAKTVSEQVVETGEMKMSEKQ